MARRFRARRTGHHLPRMTNRCQHRDLDPCAGTTACNCPINGLPRYAAQATQITRSVSTLKNTRTCSLTGFNMLATLTLLTGVSSQ